MTAPPTAHPPAAALQAYAVGALPADAAATVADHLDACPDCLREVAEATADGFVDRLRAAQVADATPLPPGSLAGPPRVQTATDYRPGYEPPRAWAGSDAPPPELVGSGEYEVVRELGRGGMGVVYLARNRVMDRLEVLKVMKRPCSTGPGRWTGSSGRSSRPPGWPTRTWSGPTPPGRSTT